jgi:hypothetical protein
MTNHWARVSGNETELFQDGGQIKREKDIHHHRPKHIPIICHLPDPPSFTLSTTFNWLFLMVEPHRFLCNFKKWICVAKAAG